VAAPGAAGPVPALRPVQLAYHVPDPARAAAEAAAAFGWGPFYLFEHIPLMRVRYRGVPATFDHTSAYGQAGELMIEFITQHDDSPSVLRDVYPAGQSGVHHVAHFVPDLRAAVAALAASGAPVALEAATADGVEFAMVDTVATLGHMTELYEPVPDLVRFYAYVRHKSQQWDGRDPVRRLGGQAN
jgi:catechol 2,3-dioxygenase-like lactoylglutathione lyase family enzyme